MSTLDTALAVEKAQELLEEGRPRQALALLRRLGGAALKAERAFLAGESLRSTGDLGGCIAPYRAAMSTGPAADPNLWLDSCAGLSAALRSLGRCPEAAALVRKGLALARAKRMPDQAERLELELVMLDRAEGRHPKALAGLSRFLRLYKRRGDKAGEGFILWAMGGARRFSGDLAGSAKDFLASLAAFGKSGDPDGGGYAMLGLGGVERIRGNLGAALSWYTRAARLFAKTGDLFARAYAECGTGNCLRQLGKGPEAAKRYLRSHRLYRLIRDEVDLAYVDWGLGMVAMHAGNLREARARLEVSLKGFLKYRETRGVVLARLALASVLHSQGRTVEAERLYDKAVAEGRAAGLHAHLEIYT